MKRKVASILALSAAVCHQAAATPSGWTTKPYQVDVDQRGSATEDYTLAGWMLLPVDQSSPHIRFSCTKRAGLVAIISSTPDLEGEVGTRVSTRRAKTNLKIEGRDRTSTTWLHVRETGILQTRDNQIAKQLFNAVITQSPFEIVLPMSKGKLTLQPPKPDKEFKEFIGACGLD